jgi:hypothetical protein
MLFVRGIAALLALAAVACASCAGGVQAQTDSPSKPREPQQVIGDFERARAGRDVELALSEFTDDAVLTVQSQSVRSYIGKDQIRIYLQAFGVQFQTLTRSTPIVQGAGVSWNERDEFQHQAMSASVFAVVREGKISSLIYRQGTFDSSLRTAPQVSDVPTLVWPAGIGLIGLLLLGLVFRRRRPASESQLGGRLLLQLRERNTPEQRRKAA